ncbi:unnamed protein product [Brachionus calyciflorus]|uniref:Uncharacterized protein n=1 Tax=Brachionus calyciflorus TaxID=104777 RepID=A0A813ZMX4_9BILA|nr:unnamed protein product [Brachionus calyciflorus]
MHMFRESMSTISTGTASPNSSELTRTNNNQYDTIYFQVYKQIDYIKKFKLNSELTNKEKDEQLKDYKKLIENLHENEAKLKVEIESLKNSLEKSEQFKKEASQKLEFMFNAIKILKDQFKEIDKQKKTIDETSEILKNENDFKRQKIKEMELRLEAINVKYSQDIEKIKLEYDCERNKFEANKEKYHNEIQTLKNQIQELLSEIKSQNQTITDFSLDIASKKEKIDTLNLEKEKLNEILCEKDKNLEILRSKEVEFVSKIDILNQDLIEKTNIETKLTETVTDSEKIISELNTCIENLKSEISTKSLENESLEEKFKADLFELSKNKDELFELKSSVFLAKISELESQIEISKTENLELVNLKLELATEKKRLEEDFKLKVDNLNNKIDNLEKDFSLKNGEFTNLENFNKKLETDFQDLEQKYRNECVNTATLQLKLDEIEPKLTNKIAVLEQVEPILKLKENQVKDLESQIKSLLDEKNDLKSQVKLKNDDIENWISKFFELEKKLEDIENRKINQSTKGLKRLQSNDSILMTQPKPRKQRKSKKNDTILKEVQSSVESTHKIESSSSYTQSLRTQTIPTYQMPKKPREVKKKDDYDLLENIEEPFFLKNYQQSLKESVETYRSKRQIRQAPKSILKKDTSTPNSSLADLSLSPKKVEKDVTSSLESF